MPDDNCNSPPSEPITAQATFHGGLKGSLSATATLGPIPPSRIEPSSWDPAEIVDWVIDIFEIVERLKDLFFRTVDRPRRFRPLRLHRHTGPHRFVTLRLC